MGKWLISAIGVSNTVGRALCGVASSLPNVSAMLVNNVMLTVGGVATIFSGLYMTVAYQFTYAIVFGFSVCEYNSTILSFVRTCWYSQFVIETSLMRDLVYYFWGFQNKCI